VSTTTVTKHATTVRNDNWGTFNASLLSADDGAYVITDGYVYNSSAYISGFGFDIPADADITELAVETEYMVAVVTTATLQPMMNECVLIGTPAICPPAGDYAWHTIRGVASIDSSTYRLPTTAELNDDWGTFGIRCTASGNIPLRIDYIRVVAKYAFLATVTTAAVTDVASDSATCGGNVTDDGSGTVSARGVCWGLAENPTLADDHTTDGSGTGSFVSSLTGLWASCVYYARSYATTEDGTTYGPQVSFSSLANAGRSLVARPFTTRAAAAESAARTGGSLIDWWLEGEVVRAELRPTTAVDVPRDRWYVVSRGTPGAVVSLTMDSEDTPDIVCVVFRSYAVANVRDGTYMRAYAPAAPTSPIQRVRLVDLSGQYMGVSDAETHAANVLLRVAADVMTATVTATGGLFTVDGEFRPAPLIQAGDWIDVVDLFGHTPTYITGTSYSRAENVVTITTGSQEQRELIIPGMASLPSAMQLSAYGAETAYDTTSDSQSESDDDPYNPNPSPEPGPEPGPVPLRPPDPGPGPWYRPGEGGSDGPEYRPGEGGSDGPEYRPMPAWLR